MLLVRRREEVVNLQSLCGTKGCVDEVDKEEVEEEVEEKIKEKALLLCQGVKCNVFYILYRGICLHA